MAANNTDFWFQIDVDISEMKSKFDQAIKYIENLDKAFLGLANQSVGAFDTIDSQINKIGVAVTGVKSSVSAVGAAAQDQNAKLTAAMNKMTGLELSILKSLKTINTELQGSRQEITGVTESVDVLRSVSEEGFSSIASSVSTLGNSLKKSDDELKETKEDTEKATDAFRTLQTVVSAVVSAFGAKLGFRFLKGVVEEAVAAQKALQGLGATFSANASKAEATAKNLASIYAVSIHQASQFLTNVGAQLQSLGVGEGLSLSMGESIIALANDISALRGGSIDTAQAIQAVVQALSGYGRSLKNMGIAITSSEMEALAKSIYGTAEGLSDTQKVLLRYQLLMEKSIEIQGSFVDAQDTLYIQNQKLKSSWDTLRATIGEQFIPILSSLVTALNSVVSGTGLFSDVLRSLLTVIPIFATLATTILLVVSAINKLKAAMAAVSIASWATPIGLIVAGLSALAVIFSRLKRAAQDAKDVQGSLTKLSSSVDAYTKSLRVANAESKQTANNINAVGKEIQAAASATRRELQLNQILNEMDGAFEKLKNQKAELNAISSTVSSVEEGYENINWALGTLSDRIDTSKLTELANNIFDADSFSEFKMALKETYELTDAGLAAVLEKLNIKEIPRTARQWEKLGQHVAKNFSDAVVSVFEEYKESAVSAWEPAFSSLSKNTTEYQKSIIGFASQYRTLVTELGNYSVDDPGFAEVQKVYDAFVAAAKDAGVWDDIWKAWKNGADIVETTTEALLNENLALKDWTSELESASQSIENRFIQGLKTAGEYIRAQGVEIENLEKTYKTEFSSMSDTIIKYLKDVETKGLKVSGITENEYNALLEMLSSEGDFTEEQAKLLSDVIAKLQIAYAEDNTTDAATEAITNKAVGFLNNLQTLVQYRAVKIKDISEEYAEDIKALGFDLSDTLISLSGETSNSIIGALHKDMSDMSDEFASAVEKLYQSFGGFQRKAETGEVYSLFDVNKVVSAFEANIAKGVTDINAILLDVQDAIDWSRLVDANDEDTEKVGKFLNAIALLIGNYLTGAERKYTEAGIKIKNLQNDILKSSEQYQNNRAVQYAVDLKIMEDAFEEEVYLLDKNGKDKAEYLLREQRYLNERKALYTDFVEELKTEYDELLAAEKTLQDQLLSTRMADPFISASDKRALEVEQIYRERDALIDEYNAQIKVYEALRDTLLERQKAGELTDGEKAALAYYDASISKLRENATKAIDIVDQKLENLSHRQWTEIVDEITDVIKRAYSSMTTFVNAINSAALNEAKALLDQYQKAYDATRDAIEKRNSKSYDRMTRAQKDAMERQKALDEAELERQQALIDKQNEVVKQQELENFKRQQAFAIIEAIINGAVGVTKALAQQNYVGAGLTAAEVATQIAAIKAQTPPSYAVGAYNLPQDQLAQVHQGEMIIPKPFATEIRENGGLAGGDVIVNIYGGTSETTAETSTGEDGLKQIDVYVTKRVKTMVARGELDTALQSRFSIGRNSRRS